MPTLSIYYDCNSPDDWRDEEVYQITARHTGKHTGCGTNLVDMVRDHRIEFDTDEALEAAKSDFEEKDFRFVP